MMKYQGLLGAPRLTNIPPLVKQPRATDGMSREEITQALQPIARDLEITIFNEGSLASADFRLPLDPPRERKSGLMLVKDFEVFETTLRYPLISERAMSGREVRENMNKVLTRANSPPKAKIEVPLRAVGIDREEKAHNPHIIVKEPDDIGIQDYVSWVERTIRAFDDFFPKFARTAEGD